MSDVVVIGAGASGLVAAIAAARAGKHVTILEGDVKPGRKLLRTGNGRCNLTNSRITVNPSQPDDDAPLSSYNNPSFARPILEKHGNTEVIGFFESIGLLCYESQEGRMYPVTNRARSVLDVLVGECARLGVEILCERQVAELRECDAGFGVILDDGSIVHARSVVLATGSEATPAEVLGIPVIVQTPVLGPLQTTSDIIKRMDGVRMRCAASLVDRTHPVEGEVLFRAHGVSGVVIFDLSRVAQTGDVLSLDLLPFIAHARLVDELRSRTRRMYAPLSAHANLDSRRTAKRTKRQVRELDGTVLRLFDGLVVREVADAVLAYCGLDARIDPADLPVELIAASLKDFRLIIESGPGAPDAQVMRGGIATSAVNPETLEIVNHPGLFACGETLDIDGACGGFNLHWAWASGLTAGAHAASIGREL